MIKIKELTEKLGISKTTLYLYFKNPETKRIGEETKRRIDRTIGELQYRVNVNAQSLSTNKSNVIAMLIPMDEPYFRSSLINETLSGIQTVLFKKNYKFIFLPAKGSRSPDILTDQIKNSHGYDGFILFGTRGCSLEDMQENVEIMMKYKVPFVVVNMPDMKREINQVIVQTPKTSNPIQFLLNLGHRKIVLMGGPRKAPDTEGAVNSYIATHREQDIEPDTSLILNGDYEKIVAKSEMIKLLDHRADFTAVFCLSDYMALGVYEAIKERGYEIPAHFSVIGRDDTFFAVDMHPSLTTVRLPMFVMGKTAAELLLRSIESEEKPRKIFLENELILRDSVLVPKK
jgi:DNA-binding LacI/PurR family transcriptional regulator